MDRIEDFEVNSPRWLSLEDFEGEVWKDVIGYEKYYMVSNYGRIKSCCKNSNKYSTKILKQYSRKGNRNYWKINLFKNGVKKHKFVHRLVAEAFIPNPNNLPEVNHKDENKLNPHFDNLEWCDRKYNCNYGTLPNRLKEHMIRRRKEDILYINGGGIKHKEVHQFDLNGKYIESYYSLKDAEKKTGINSNTICDVCKGRVLSAGGFLWDYKKEHSEMEMKAKYLKGKGRRRKIILPIGKYTLENKLICLYDNASIAARDVGVHYSNIIRCAKGERKQCAGFIWKYHTL